MLWIFRRLTGVQIRYESDNETLEQAIENMIKLNKEIPSIDVEQVTRW